MKALRRGLVWWPGTDTDVEKLVKECSPCQQTQPSPPLAPLHPWEWRQRPWSRLHVDFAGTIEGKMLLVVIDAYSKWVEAIPIGSTTAALTRQQVQKQNHDKHLKGREFQIGDHVYVKNGSSGNRDRYNCVRPCVVQC